jgi:tRNA modification GTPase
MTSAEAPMSARLITPPGTGAIAVIRVTGPRAGAVVAGIFRPGAGESGESWAAGRLRYGRLVDGDEWIDDVVTAWRAAGEIGTEAVDICTHGGTRIVARTLLALERQGAAVESATEGADAAVYWPAANPVEAEADRALARACTRRGVVFLAAQRARLADHLCGIVRMGRTDLPAATRELRALLTRWQTNRYLLEGARVAVLGPPNSGKSTLVNRLVQREAVLTSPQAGTTRDWTAHEIAVEGVPLTVLDTAGVREPSGALEAQAIERGLAEAASADVRLLVLDRSRPLPAALMRRILRDLGPYRLLVAVNKIDLPPCWQPDALTGLDERALVCLSALTGRGVEAMPGRLIALLDLSGTPETGPNLFSSSQADVVSAILSEGADGSDRLADGIRRLTG